ncbi:GTP cyclohydrolase II [Reinekea thalattae]|uniref:GTP cyclohydrolase-2 n=1 Tax=Reinekea thalattae TaxID=2593301 RepID=A0A5C8ZB13_9GAMM|nr:GTP cyclohydrolase II [Reinekea thalattae]TXR54469.1 GTP cyclohydrolase II [Reinekea thalattae]
MAVKFIESCKLPTVMGTFDMHGFDDNGKEQVVLTYGDVSGDEPVLIRIHSECLTGDALFSLKCDCGPQLEAAMKNIVEQGRGAILYLRQEGRGIGLLNKIRAYHLQDCGLDTVEANEKLGFAADMREYSMLSTMLEHVGIKKVKVMTNNPRKLEALKAAGVEVVEQLTHMAGLNSHNKKYLSVKSDKLGHLITPDLLTDD